MNFDYFESERKHLFEHYDSLPLIAVHTFNEQDFLLYAIDWKDLSAATFMIVVVNPEEVEQFKQGAKAFLQSKLDQGELYHYTFGFLEDSPPNVARLLTEEEAIEVFPTDEFTIDYDYVQSACWVL